ncbi:hypothetical protein [Endozoicomonas montiporae]|uniref:hypothetical protein n=1 Tax=Endozoicomonas montiporae TaxID=1027273 RepID=UPI00119DB5FF|nr:hypothetical protein [Endozoicomonas montiporae]
MKDRQALLEEFIKALIIALDTDFTDTLANWITSHPDFCNNLSPQETSIILKRLNNLQISAAAQELLPQALLKAYSQSQRQNHSIKQKPPKTDAKKEKLPPQVSAASTTKPAENPNSKPPRKKVTFLLPPKISPDQPLQRRKKTSSASEQHGKSHASTTQQDSVAEDPKTNTYDTDYPKLPAPQPPVTVRVPKILRTGASKPKASDTSPATGENTSEPISAHGNTDKRKSKEKVPRKKRNNRKQSPAEASTIPTADQSYELSAEPVPSTSAAKTSKSKSNKDFLPPLKPLSEEELRALIRKNEAKEAKKQKTLEKKRIIAEKRRADKEDEKDKKKSLSHNQAQPSTSATSESQSVAQYAEPLPPASDDKSATPLQGAEYEVSSVSNSPQAARNRTHRDSKGSKYKRKKNKKFPESTLISQTTSPESGIQNPTCSADSLEQPPLSEQNVIQQYSLEIAYQYFMDNPDNHFQIWEAISGAVNQFIQNQEAVPEQLETLLWIAARENQEALQALFRLHSIGKLNRPLRLLRTLQYFLACRYELLQQNTGNINSAPLGWIVVHTVSNNPIPESDTSWEEIKALLLSLLTHHSSTTMATTAPDNHYGIAYLLRWFSERGFHSTSSPAQLPAQREQLTNDFLADSNLLSSVSYRLRQRVVQMILIAHKASKPDLLPDQKKDLKALLYDHYLRLEQWVNSLPAHIQHSEWVNSLPAHIQHSAEIDPVAFIHQHLDRRLAATWVNALGAFADIPQHELNHLSRTLLEGDKYYEKHFCEVCKDYNPYPCQFCCDNEHLFFMHANCASSEPPKSTTRKCPENSNPAAPCQLEANGFPDHYARKEIREGFSSLRNLEALSSAALLPQNYFSDTPAVELLTQLVAADISNQESLSGIVRWLELEFFDGDGQFLTQFREALEKLVQQLSDDKIEHARIVIQKINQLLAKLKY